MGTISMFYGILIRMYLGKKSIILRIFMQFIKIKKLFLTLKPVKTEGNLPSDKEKLVTAWIILHKDELLADWELAQNGELPYNIDPLK